MGCEKTLVALWGVECHLQLAEDFLFHWKKRKEGRKEVSYPKVNSTAQPICGSIANLSDKQLKLKYNLSYFGLLAMSILPFLAMFFFPLPFSGKHDIGSPFFFKFKNQLVLPTLNSRTCKYIKTCFRRWLRVKGRKKCFSYLRVCREECMLLLQWELDGSGAGCRVNCGEPRACHRQALHWLFMLHLCVLKSWGRTIFVCSKVVFKPCIHNRRTDINPGRRSQDGCVFSCMIKQVVHMTVRHLKIISVL